MRNAVGFPEVEARLVRGAGGVQIFAREGGQRGGPPILFIHGWLFSSDVFVRQFSGELAQTHHLIAMDVRGHGRSGKPDFDAAYLDAAAQADDVAAVIESFGLDKPIIVGWSMGSRIALNYGWFHGYEKVAGFNLVSAVVAGPTRGPDAPSPPYVVELLSPDEIQRLAATQGFVARCAGGGALSPGLAAAFTNMAMTVPVTARRGSRRWPILYAERLPELATPLLVTHGLGDSLVPEANSRELASLSRAGRLGLLEGGHLPFFHDAARFDASLAAFAASVHQSQD